MCKQCGSEATSYLSSLQDLDSVEGADCTPVTSCLSRISAIGEVGAWASPPSGIGAWGTTVPLGQAGWWHLWRGCASLRHSSPSCPQELRPRGLDVEQEELGDLVDKEMAATSAAIETAAARIEVNRHCKGCPTESLQASGHPWAPRLMGPPARGWAWQPGGAGGSAWLLPSARRC